MTCRKLPSPEARRGYSNAAATLLALLSALSCTGSIRSSTISGGAGNGGPTSGTGDPTGVNPDTQQACAAADLGPTRAPLRRLTATQYSNTLQDLLKDPAFPAQTLPAESVTLGFYNNADSQTPTTSLIEDYQSGAVLAGASVLKNRSTMVPCTTNDAACGINFITSFGRRVFRRPLTDDEKTRFTTFFANQLQASNFNVALQLVTQALLNAPQFLYLPEFGTNASGAIVPLSSYELATRLAYLLTDTTPDDTLLDAAASGLSTPAQIQAQVTRLLSSPRARTAVSNFHTQWLDLERLDNDRVQKNTAVFPQWSAALKDSMRQEVANFVQATIFDGDGKLSTLLTSSRTWVDTNLAPIYGVTAPPGGGFVDLDPTQRAGILTMPSFLAGHAHQTQTSPVWRGLFVLEQMLCVPPLVPPKNVNTTVVDTPTTANTGREREAAHGSNPQCSGCHTLIDGVGFTFESFDAIGHYRTQEADSGEAVDSTGSLHGTDVDGPVANAVDLAHKLAGSDQVRLCATTEWFRYAFAFAETSKDACTIQAINKSFANASGDVRALLTAIATSKAFVNRPAFTTN